MARNVSRERAAQQRLLRRAERSIDAATLRAMSTWLDAVRFALVQELGIAGPPEAIAAAASWQQHRKSQPKSVTSAKWSEAQKLAKAAAERAKAEAQPRAVQNLDYAIDAAVQRSWGVWQNQLENQVLPTVSVAFGDAFQQVRRGDPQGAFAMQQQYLAEVSDRLKMWPDGAFEDIRPELLEALSEAETVDQMTDRIGRVLTIDARSRELRARINEVETALTDPDLSAADAKALRSYRRDLWTEHDESLNEWQWKARRIARTESHGAVTGGQLAAAQRVQDETGIRMWKRWLCVAGDTPVSAVGTALVARRHYEGTAVTITTASGATVTLTPQHEVLTGRGWVAAEQVSERDHLFKVAGIDPARTPDVERRQSTIAEVFDAAVQAESVKVGSVPVGVYLDGDDPTKEHVYVVPTDGVLTADLAAQFEGMGDLAFADANSLAEFAMFGGGAAGSLVGGDLMTGDTGERDGATALSDLGAFPRDANETSLGAATPGHARLVEDAGDGGLRASDRTGDAGEGFAADVEHDQVVSVDIGAFRGHVYDLSTSGEWFAADALVIHNCTDDTRTRVEHRVADGQTVPLDQPFRVGGWLLQHPAGGNPVVPGHITINCRCSMILMDDDELQDEFEMQGGKGPVEPGSVRIGPDDADVADAAIAEAAETEGRDLPKLGQRGEDVGQAMPDLPDDVQLTDERSRVPLPDVESASDERLADYLVRTDETDNPELRSLVEDELARRRDPISVSVGEPEHVDDPLVVDDDEDWLDDERLLHEAGDLDEPDPEFEPPPDPEFDDWLDEPDGDPDDEVVDPGPLDIERLQREHDAAIDAMTEAIESGDEDRMLAAIDEAEAAERRLTEAMRYAETPSDPIFRDDDDPDTYDVDDDLEPDLDDDDDLEWPDDEDDDREQAADEARDREIWGDLPEEPAPLTRQPTEAELRRMQLMDEADEKAQREGISYEQALAELQGLDRDQLFRREFVARAKAEGGLSSTNFNDLLDELHNRVAFDWHMSDEAAAWFDENGRITKGDLRAMIEDGRIAYDASSILALYATWPGRRLGGDYLA